MIININWWVF